jgi:hypothetical protein
MDFYKSMHEAEVTYARWGNGALERTLPQGASR